MIMLNTFTNGPDESPWDMRLGFLHPKDKRDEKKGGHGASRSLEATLAMAKPGPSRF